MRTPSTSITSVPASARSPRRATFPLMVTEPASMRSSQMRRLPMPTRARIFCTRSGVAGSFSGIDSVGQEALLQRLDDVGARHELSEARKVVERGETETFEEQARRAVQHGEAGAGIARHLFDQPTLLQRAHH